MTMRRPVWASLLAVVTAIAVYGPTLRFGLYWDDFTVLRPWSWHDVAATFTGPYRPWDPAVLFYRPLTSLYYAVISTVWGWQTVPLHALVLLLVATLGVLTVQFVWRESGNVAMVAIAAVLVIVHPTLATSIGPWIANQGHTLLLVCFITALFGWQHGRQTPRAWWWRATPWLVAAAWFKEDGLLLPAALVVAQWMRARITRDLPPPSRRTWVALLAVSVALILWRGLWLESSLGYGLRTPAQMLANLLRAPRYVLLWQVGPRVVAWPAMVAKAVILMAAVWVLLRARQSAGARLIVTGLTLLCVANLPLTLVSSEGRWHVLGWGAVLLSAGALGEWATRAPRWGWPATALVLAALTASSIERVATFSPCSRDSVTHAREMADEVTLPAPLRDWLRQREADCAAGRVEMFSVPMRSMTWRSR